MATSIIREETKRIFNHLKQMLDLVVDNHMQANAAITGGNSAIANKVIEDDKAIDQKYLAIESELEFLIAKTPFARDLRRTLAALHIADELERIGDYAKHIARFVIKTPHMSDSSIKRIQKVHLLCLHMLRSLTGVLLSEDASKATVLAKEDDAVDNAVQEIKTVIIGSLVNKSDPKAIEERVNVLNINNALERAADHVVIICELIVYIETGEHTIFF